MEDEGRELTEEELEELQKDIAYCNATSMPQTKNDGYYSEAYSRLNPYYDSDYAKIVFVIGDVFTFFLSIGLIFGGVFGKVYVCLWIGVASLILCILGTIIRYFPNKKSVDSIMDGETNTQLILGTILALHVTPLGLIALASYLLFKEDDVKMKQLRKYSFYTACKSAKEYKGLYDALNYDYYKKKISEDVYTNSIFELKKDLNIYVAKLDERVKVIESRIIKGLASQKDLQREIDFVNNEKEIAYSILNPALLEKKKEENSKKDEEFKSRIPALLEDLEAKVYQLEEEKVALYKTYKSYYESGIYSIEEYYERLNKLFEK